jgi:hypothetical protein
MITLTEKILKFISSIVLSFFLLIGLVFSLFLKPRGFWGLIKQWFVLNIQQI